MGAAQSCANGHRLLQTDIQKFTNNWRCDECHRSYTDVNSMRWRCISDCDYDICVDCTRKLVPGVLGKLMEKPSDLPTVLAIGGTPRATAGGSPSGGTVSQSNISHKHYVAYVSYKCNECGDDETGDRLFCPKCMYDRCFGCALKMVLNQNIEDSPKSLSIEPKPFAEGMSRQAYVADVTMNTGRKAKYVLKSWKPRFFNEGHNMAEIVKIHLKAYELAQKFNKEVPINRKIIFKKPFLHTMSRTIEIDGKNAFVKGEKVALEPFIYGEYEKFNSNNGWMDADYVGPAAFSHFTWHATKELIVCDLQGVRQVSDSGSINDGYYLTDPAICSITSGKWGLTDVGPEGIMAFFKNHRCSPICKSWDRPSLSVAGMPTQRSTSYLRQVGGRDQAERQLKSLIQNMALLMAAAAIQEEDE